MIPFNKACVTGREIKYIQDAMNSGQIAGDGSFTHLCHNWFKTEFKIPYNLLTTSCSMAIDMAALLLNIQPGDEVIMPSFTFVSTANSFAIRGAKIRFIDIRPDTMNIDENLLESAITKKTKAIVPVHYAGVSCEMNTINDIAQKYKIAVVEDAAQGVKSKYKGQYLGTLSDIGCYSFHATKNYTAAGEGGLIILKSEEHFKRAEIIREKGTNRSQFFRGEVDKYTWVDVGSSFLPSDINAAYLYAQLEFVDAINNRRIEIWNAYNQGLQDLAARNLIQLPYIPEHCEHNAHMFYIKMNSAEESLSIGKFMKERKVNTPFHYVPLHSSPTGLKYGEFIGTDRYTTSESQKLIRLPLFYNMTNDEVTTVLDLIYKFFKN